jgi:hypothetical protein
LVALLCWAEDMHSNHVDKYIYILYIYYKTLIPTQISRQSWTWLCILSRLCHILPICGSLDQIFYSSHDMLTHWRLKPTSHMAMNQYLLIPFLVGYSHP